MQRESIAGSVHYSLEVLNPIDTIKLMQNMSFTAVKLNDMPVPYLNTAKQLQIIRLKKVKMKLVLNTATLSRLCIS
jgi:aminopeptidase N